METIIYILKVNLYCILFYMCYWILLRRHTFFKLNRLYLVSTLFLSLALPFVEFTETVRILPSPMQVLPEPTNYLVTVSPGIQTDWIQVTLIIYGIGMFYMLAKLLLGFHRLFLLLKQGEQIEMESYTLIILPKVTANSKNLGSFSFFNFLFVSNYDYENCFDIILRHEYVHIKQKHSYDILLIEIFKMVFWFNPVLWLYKYSLREIHEFLADQQAQSKDAYARFLISYAQDAAFTTITNNFFNSFLLKDRIKMIYSKSTSYWLLSKYILIVPIIAFTVMKTAARNQIYIKSQPESIADVPNKIENSDKSISQDSVTKSVNKIKPEPVTYNERSSKIPRKNSKQTAKVNEEIPNAVGLPLKDKDTLWENYKPKHSAYDYYNRTQKVRKNILLLPTLDKFGNGFNKSANLSKQNAPVTEMPNARIGLSRREN